MRFVFAAVALFAVSAVAEKPAAKSDKKPMAPAAAPAAAAPAPAAAPAAAAPTATEVTLSGTVTCAKCGLKAHNNCNTAISVKEGEKANTYLFDADWEKTHHEAYCKAKKEGTVTGIVSEKDGKKYIKVSKVDVK